MAVTDWIDEVVKLAGSVKAHNKGYVRAYLVFKKTEIPETISEFPCAITYVEGLRASYSQGGPCIDLWDGVTEFHLFPDLNKSNFPEMIRYYGKIRTAWAANMSLGGRVEHCVLKAEEAITMVKMTYGSEAEHHGLMVHWEVKENVTGMFTVG